MPTIHQFQAQMSKGFARPNLFKVEISEVATDVQYKYQMRCFQAQIPGHNIATTDKDIGFRSIAYQKIFSDVILGFYVSGDLAELEFWQGWIDRIINPITNHHGYYNTYVGKIKITQENRFGQNVATWTLHDAYPKQVDPIQLDYGTNDAVMTCNTTITYRHFTVVWHKPIVTKEKRKDKPEEENVREEVRYGHSVRTDLNKIHPMLEILLDRQNWKLRDGSPDESNYAGWDNMTSAQQHIVREYYRLHGPSKHGGARNTITT